MKELDTEVQTIFGDAEKPLSISALQAEIHALAKEKGWYDSPRTPPELHMLMVTELAEATEEARKDTPPIYGRHVGTDNTGKKYYSPVQPGEKPEGELIELADCVIRILDYCGYRDWDLEKAINLKHTYNKSRAYRHGNKKY